MSEISEKSTNSVNNQSDNTKVEFYKKRKQREKLRKKIIWTFVYILEATFIIGVLGIGLYTGFVGRFPFDFSPKYSSTFFEDEAYAVIVDNEIGDYYNKDNLSLDVITQQQGERSVQHLMYVNMMSDRFVKYASEMFKDKPFIEGYYSLRSKLPDWVPVDEVIIKRPSTYYYYQPENMVHNDFESMEENIKDVYLIGDRKEIATSITSFLLMAGMKSEDIMVNIPHEGGKDVVISMALPTQLGVRHYIYDRKTWSFREYGVNDTWSDYIYNLNYLDPDYMFNDEVDHNHMDLETAEVYQARTTHEVEVTADNAPREGYDFSIEQLSEPETLKANLENYVYEQAKKETNLYMTEVKYAYKTLFVKYPELYLQAAQTLDTVKDYALTKTIQDELAFMNTVEFDPHSIYTEDYRMMRPDQVIFYKRGEANDVANMIYTMARIQGKDALITFTTEGVYVVYSESGEVKIVDAIKKEFVNEVKGKAYMVMDEENAYYPLMNRFVVTKDQKSLLDAVNFDLGDNIVVK